MNASHHTGSDCLDRDCSNGSVVGAELPGHGLVRTAARALLGAALVVTSMAAQAQVTEDLFGMRPGGYGTGDFFGRAVAMDDTSSAIVGVPRDDDPGTDGGTARVYTRDAQNNWQAGQKIRADDGFAGDAFGWSVAIQGNTAVVGAPSDSDNGNASGSVYVFTLNSTFGTWLQTQKITASDAATGDAFGTAVAISGNSLSVGAAGDNDSGSGSGSVYQYERAGNGTWVFVAKILAPDGTSSDQFGAAIAASGSLLAIGHWRAGRRWPNHEFRIGLHLREKQRHQCVDVFDKAECQRRAGL